MAASRRPAPTAGDEPGTGPATSPATNPASGAASSQASRTRPAARRQAGGGGRARLTSRAAILAVVVCAIALSLAYPIREYIAQRREIAALREQERVAQRQVETLTRKKQRLGDESYIRREARSRLHYCMPGEKCYVVLDGNGGNGRARPRGAAPVRTPPWYLTLWRSVEAADRRH
jgi:cell division protein FtsB